MSIPLFGRAVQYLKEFVEDVSKKKEPVLKAEVGANMTPQQTKKAQEVITKYTRPDPAITGPKRALADAGAILNDATTVKTPKPLIAPLTPRGEQIVKNLGPQTGPEPDVIFNKFGINSPLLESSATSELLAKNKAGKIKLDPEVVKEAEKKFSSTLVDLTPGGGGLGIVGSTKNVGKEIIKDVAEKAGKKVGSLVDDAAEVITDKFAYNINLNRLDLTPQEKGSLISKIDKVKPELQAIKGRALTHEEVINAAKESEVLTSVITREETEQIAAQNLRTRQRITEIEKTLPSTKDPGTREALIKEQIDLLKADSSYASDVARRLGQRKITAGKGENTVYDQIIKRLTKVVDDTDELAKRASTVDFTNQKDVTNFYREYVKPTWKDALEEYRYNNMLSNPRTQARNIFGNILQTTVTRPLTKTVEAGLDVFASKLSGKERNALFREVPAYYKGVLSSIPEAADDFLRAFKGETAMGQPDLLDNIPLGDTSKLPVLGANSLGEAANNAATRTLQKLTFGGIPTRILEGTDRFLMKMVSTGEYAALRQRGVPADKAAKEANKIAEYNLFRNKVDPNNKSGQGKVLSGIDSMTAGIDSLRKKIPGASWFIPFLRTPMNVTKQWIEYSPLGLTTLVGSDRKAQQIAKSMIGSGVTLWGANMAMQDNTTWATPKDPKERELFYASGRKPYSVKIGDRWVPMIYFGPAAYALALPAAMKYYQKDSPTALTDGQIEKVGKTISSLGELLSQQTFLQGLGNFVDTIRGSGESPTSNLGFTAGQVIPLQGLLRYVATAIDPVYRQSNSFLESLQRDLPFLSKGFDVPGTDVSVDALQPYTLPSGEESKRDLTSYFAPYDIPKARGEYEDLLAWRTEQMQSNAFIASNDAALNKEASKIVGDLYDVETEEDAKKVMEKLSGNVQLKKTVETLIKQQAQYTLASLEPLQIFKDKPNDLAEIIYTRMMTAEDDKQAQENVTDFLKELEFAGLYNDKVKTALKELILKESLQDEGGNDAEDSEEGLSIDDIPTEE